MTRIYINREKPYITYLFMAINLALFASELFMQYILRKGQSLTLLTLGAKENTLITCGEYWRLVTCCFLHSGVLHLLSNMIGLYFWGPYVEQLMGHFRLSVIYLFSGIFGSLCSYAFSNAWAVGASGALFGLFGALLYFRTRHRQVFDTVFGMQVLIIIGFNLVNGFITTGIDNWGHIGGLIGGFAMSYVTGLYREKPNLLRALALIGLIALSAGLFLFGMWKYSAALGIPMFTIHHFDLT